MTVFAASALPAQDRLVAETETDGPLGHYQATLRQVLDEAYAPEVRLRAVVQPSWALEYAVGIRRSPNGHEVFMVEPSRQVWTYTSIELLRSGRAGVMTLDGGDATGEEIARLERICPRIRRTFRCRVAR
jgi:hypothetical protein